jgi:hypothetical protein
MPRALLVVRSQLQQHIPAPPFIIIVIMFCYELHPCHSYPVRMHAASPLRFELHTPSFCNFNHQGRHNPGFAGRKHEA